MAVGFCPNLQEQLSLQDDTYDARGLVDTLNGTRRCDELILQLCDWIIPRESVQVTNDGHQQKHAKISVSIHGSCSNGDDTLHPNQIIQSNLLEPRESQNERIGDSRKQKLGRTKFTSPFDFGSTALCCRHELRERTCAVKGAGFCLGSLSMINHCAEFGGGAGIDRDGAQVSGKFCGVGAKYKVSKISPPNDLMEVHGNVKPANSMKALNLDSSRLFNDPEVSAQFVYGKKMLFTGISMCLRGMVGALNNVRLFVLPRVPDLDVKVLPAMNEFTGYAVRFLNAGSINDNVIYFERSMAGVLMDFDPNEFLKILYVSDEEVTACLLNTLKEWNEALRNFLEFYVDGPNGRVHEEK